MKTLTTFLLATVVVAHAAVSDNEWQAYKQKHGKEYADEDVETQGRNAYAQKKTLINQHNQLYANGQVSFKLGTNKYSDIPHAQFVRTMNGYRRPSTSKVGASATLKRAVRSVGSLPAYVDWRNKGAVTAVKDQGQVCQACWSFAATGALEGRRFIRTGVLVSLSEQNLIDCAGSAYGNSGCGGGFMEGALRYVVARGGIDTEAYYPYQGEQGTCRYNPNYIGASATRYVALPSGSETALQNAVVAIGPIAVSVDASLPSFQSYESGIYHDPRCSSTNMDHNMLVVGYGSTGGIDYWIVKNSWGTSWGEQGYMRMVRNKNNHCGIATDAGYPA